MSVCPCLALPQAGGAVGDMQNSWCMRSRMCSAVRERGAAPCAVGAACDPSAAKTLWRRQEPPCSPSAVRGEGGEDLVNNFARGFISFLFFCFLKKKKTNNPKRF